MGVSELIASGVVHVERQMVRPGFSTRSLRPSLFPGVPLNPFISADHFEMSQPIFPPHPHAGFSAVTYMLERSPGAFINRDSLGDRSTIRPGDLHWTAAAHGMMHEEVPENPGTVCEGVQLFVNLSAKNKTAPPRAFHSGGDKCTRVKESGLEIKILSGQESGKNSSLKLLERFDYLDISVAGSPNYSLLNPSGFSTVAYAYEGQLDLCDSEGSEFALSSNQAFAWSSDEDSSVSILKGRGKLLLFRAPKLNEPLVFGGPFIMNSKEEIDQAQRRFLSGSMGHLSPSF